MKNILSPFPRMFSTTLVPENIIYVAFNLSSASGFDLVQSIFFNWTKSKAFADDKSNLKSICISVTYIFYQASDQSIMDL